MFDDQRLKKLAFEDQTLKKSTSDDQNRSQSKCKDQCDSNGPLSTSEPTLSHEDLSSILFIEHTEMQLIIPLATKEFQTTFQHQ